MGKVVRFQERFPTAYVNESRDFQLLCRLMDSWVNGIKYNTDSIIYSNSTQYINSNLISCLQSKLGFYTRQDYSASQLRLVLGVFNELIKNKGTSYGVKLAVKIFARALEINTSVFIVIVNKNDNNTGFDDYSINIGFESVEINDMSLLDEILDYIKPIGYTVHYFFYSKFSHTGSDVVPFILQNRLNILFTGEDNLISVARAAMIDGQFPQPPITSESAGRNSKWYDVTPADKREDINNRLAGALGITIVGQEGSMDSEGHLMNYELHTLIDQEKD